MEPRRWIIHFYGTKSGFIDHLNLSLAELLDDSLHGTSTPTSSPLTPASTRSSPIEEWPNTRNAISPDSGSGLFVSLRGTYNKLPDQSSRGCTNYDLSRGFEDDDSDVISGVPSDEDQGSRSEEIFTAGGEGTVDAGGNNQILGNDEVMDDIEDQIEDPEQPIDVHGDETMKDLEDDKSVEEFGGTDNPERPQGSNGVGGDEDAGHSEADDSIRENPDAPEDVDEEIDVEDTGADGLIEEDQEASEGGVEDTGIDGSIEEDQEASEGGVEDTGIDGSIGEDQDVPERGAEDTGIDGSTREDAEASKGGPEDTGIDGSIGEDQDVPERGAEDTGIDGSTREDKEASEGGAEDTGIDGFIGEDEDVPERGAENIEIDRFTREDTEGSGEVNEDENTGNAGDQDGIGGKGREDEELVKAQTKTRKRWVEAADRIIQGGLSIAKSRELLSVAYNHEALRALLSLEVQGPKSYPLGSLTGGDPLRVAARYLEYSTRLEERLTWYKRVGHFTQVVAVSWCEILRHSGCTNEEVDAMIQKAMGKSFTPRWLKDARRGVKFVHRLIRALREDGWGDTAFEIFFLCERYQHIAEYIADYDRWTQFEWI